MSFEKRIIVIVLLSVIAAVFIGGAVFAWSYFTQIKNDNTVLVVKRLPSPTSAPKAILIPANSKTNLKANISNPVLSSFIKRPVVVTL